MDIPSLLIQILGAIWWVMPVFIVITMVKTSWFKGFFGEFVVNISAKLMLDKKQYRLIKNVTLPTEDGTTQIDHIIVSVFGVFVMETKNMKGWIFGNTKQKSWTQKIFKHSSKFQNPLHQNYKHVKTLESLLGLSDEQMHSLIVFVGNSEFKTKMPENVTYGGGFISFIKSKTTKVLTPQEVRRIARKIEQGRLTRSIKTNREHVKHVKEIVANKEVNANTGVGKEASKKKGSELASELPNQDVKRPDVKVNDAPSCPKCDEIMVLRETKKGDNAGKKFWGCAKFPKCRAMMKA